MAERDFLAIVFDPSYTGESVGEPRIQLLLINVQKRLRPQFYTI